MGVGLGGRNTRLDIVSPMMMMNQSTKIIISAENGMQAEEVCTGVVVSGLSNLVVRLCIEDGPKSKMATSVNQASTRRLYYC